MTLTEFKPAPCALIDDSGRPAFGVYTSPLKSINLKDFDYRKVAPFPWSLLPSSARLAIKRWQYMGFVSDQIVVGMAVVDIGYVANAFVYWYRRGDNTMKDYSFLDLTKKNVLFSGSSVEGISEYSSGAVSIRMDNSLSYGPRRAQVSIGDELSLDLEMDESEFTPLCVVAQNGLRGFNYCHKAAGLPVKGSVTVQGDTFELSGENALGMVDWTAGCASRETFWNWASGAGRLEDGRSLGINFVSGINDRGFTENGYWVDGKPVKVDTVYFDYDPAQLLTKPWKIESNDGKVRLMFKADNERAENLNFGLLVSRFHQPFGSFEGTLEVEGKPTPVQFYGFVEEHEARW